MEDVQSVLPPDRISYLPDNISETILTYLPTRDAVRTSMLSRKWRHVWAKIPQFVLDKTLWEGVAIEHSAETTLMKILYQLLLRHDGPIKKFTLSNPDLKSCREIDNLIFFLTKSHLEDFTLEMWKDCYKLPSSLFSCETLRHLRLRSCSIRSSLASEGFNRLTTMVLIDIPISSETLESLISACPLLGVLELTISSGIDICIDALNLKTFIFYGSTKSINFKRVPVLAAVSIKQNESKEVVNFVGVGCNTIKFFQMLPFIESLELSYRILLGFVDIEHRRLPTSLIYLEDLKLYEISFNDMVDLSFTFCILRFSPNMKFIDILFADYSNSNSEKTTAYMEGEDYSDICLNELQNVKLADVTGTKPELEFIRLLLANSSSLKRLHIHPKKTVDDNGFKILKEVVKFRRISKEAEIIFAE